MSRFGNLTVLGTETAAVFSQRFTPRDGSKWGVIHCHGLNGQPWHVVNTPDPVIEEMVGRGHWVLSPENGGTSVWGNDLSQTKLQEHIGQLGGLGARAGKALLWCGSMGTLCGLNTLRAHPELIAGIAVGLPAVDLADLHDNAVARGITAATVEGAYGGTLAGYNAARAAHNPAEHAAEYAPYKNIIKLWRSADDTTVIPAVVDAFGAASGVPVVNMGSTGGHVFPASRATEVADFLESL